MALSDVQIRSLKPADKLYKITDEKGLYLEVSPNGSKLWRYKYLYMGKNKRIELGRYPEVGLGEARRRRLEARDHLDNGVDPSANRKREKLIAVYQAANTFGDMAKEYLEKMVGDRRAETTISKAHWLLEQLKPIADQTITLLKPVDVLAALKRLEAHGKYETARRCRSFASRVFRYAVAIGRGETDPTAMLLGALVVPRTTHHAALLEPKDVGDLPRAIDAYSGHKVKLCNFASLDPKITESGRKGLAGASQLDRPADRQAWRKRAIIPCCGSKLGARCCARIKRQTIEYRRLQHRKIAT